MSLKILGAGHVGWSWGAAGTQSIPLPPVTILCTYISAREWRPGQRDGRQAGRAGMLIFGAT